jgi:hypothetical protein
MFTEPIEPTDFDGAWKETLEVYLGPFLDLCFPAIAHAIDESHAPHFLDKELQALVPDANSGTRHVDKLARVHLLDGTVQTLLVHIELQSQRDQDLPARLFRYHHRLLDRFPDPVVTLAVLADTSPSWHPKFYERDTLGCRVRLEFPTCKFLNFNTHELEASPNPVAIILLAHRAAQLERGDPVRLKAAKWRLTRNLLERGWDADRIRRVYRLIDWLIRLPRQETQEFYNDLHKLEQENVMPFITSIEEIGIEKGLARGLQQGLEKGQEFGKIRNAREAVLEVLIARFESVPDPIPNAIASISHLSHLTQLLRLAATCPSLDAFLHDPLLPTHPTSEPSA